MLSTLHDDKIIEKRRRTRSAPGGIEFVRKLEMIADYNQHMGSVDKAYPLLWFSTQIYKMVEKSILSPTGPFNSEC